MPSKMSPVPSSSNPSTETTGAGGELHQTVGGKHLALTTNQGLPIADNQNS